MRGGRRSGHLRPRDPPGNTVCTADGRAHLFHGVDRPSLEWSSVGSNLSLADFQLMASWNANVVRIALNQDFWIAASPLFDPSYASLVDTVVAWARRTAAATSTRCRGRTATPSCASAASARLSPRTCETLAIRPGARRSSPSTAPISRPRCRSARARNNDTAAPDFVAIFRQLHVPGRRRGLYGRRIV